MPAQDRQTAPYGVFSKAREERNEDGLRLRHKEKAADALHTQAGTTAACQRESSRPPGGTLRHSAQRSPGGGLGPATACPENRSGQPDHRHDAGPCGRQERGSHPPCGVAG